MLCKKLCFFLILVAYSFPSVRAQSDSATSKLTLPEVIVEDYINPESQFLSKWGLFDSLRSLGLAGLSVSELVAFSGLANVKNYGVNGISTMSLRGSSAEQTAILWNGININNPQLGQTDISILPTDMFESIDIQPNTSVSSLNAIGGSIELNSNENIDSLFSIRVGAKVGSFQDIRSHFSCQKAYNRFRTKIFCYGQSQKNNILYKNPYQNNRLFRLEHAKNQQIGGKFTAAYNFRQGVVQYVCWIQRASRQIPPTLSQSFSDATQHDFFCRNLLMISLSHSWLKKITFARLDDQIRFEDFQANIHSFGRSVRYLGNISSKSVVINKIASSISVFSEFTTASIPEYRTPKDQMQLSVKGSSIYTNRWFGAQIGASYQLVSRMNIPVTGAILLYIYPFFKNPKLSKLIKVSANVAREVRIPTLNDRYWQPGGNSELLPEESWRKEIILALQRPQTKVQLTGFHKNVKNWIQWLPVGGFFAPKNLPLVVAQGIETTLDWQTIFLKGIFKVSFLGSLNSTRKEKSKQVPDESLHKQMIFNPIYNASAQISYHQKRWFGQITSLFKGYRFILADNSDYLPGYLLMGVSGGRNFKILKNNWLLAAGVENLLNQSYQIMPGRPMPGISMWFSIKYKFN